MTDRATLGAYLRAARRRRRVSIERAADQTRIRSDYLMRMESDEFDFLAPAYVRSFLRTYARFLRIDTVPLVEEFDRMFGRDNLDTSTILELERRVTSRARRTNSWAVASIVALAMIAGLAAVGIASAPENDDSAPVARANNVANTSEGDDGTVTSPTPEADNAIAFTNGIDLEVAATDGDCWLEVYADGELLYYQILPAGASETFRAENRMFVELGFPSAVELTVNGQNIGSPGGEEPMQLLLPRDIRGLL